MCCGMYFRWLATRSSRSNGPMDMSKAMAVTLYSHCKVCIKWFGDEEALLSLRSSPHNTSMYSRRNSYAASPCLTIHTWLPSFDAVCSMLAQGPTTDVH